MKSIYKCVIILAFVLSGVSYSMAQDGVKKEFRFESIIEEIDKPDGMTVLGNYLYVSRYSKDGSIVKYDLANKNVVGTVADGLQYPTGLLTFEDKILVLEYGTGSLYAVYPDENRKEILLSGFSRPADIIQYGENLLISDFGRGTIYEVNPKTLVKTIFAKGLSSPAGMAIFEDKVHVVEWGMGRITAIDSNGEQSAIVSEQLSSPWGLMVYQNELFVAENGSNQISRVFKKKIPVENSSPKNSFDENSFAKDSVTVWSVASMKCGALKHPEAFCVSDRGIFVSEWKNKKVSQIRLNSPPTGLLAIEGKPKIGQVLEAQPINIKDEDGLGSFTFGWEVAEHPDAAIWTSIREDKSEHKLKKRNLEGKYIRATISYIDEKGFNEYVVSEAVRIVRTPAPLVTLSFSPESIFQPGDTITLTAEVNVLDEDAKQDKVDFYADGIHLVSLEEAPYSYKFVVSKDVATKEYIDQFSIVAKGYDSNGAYGEDETTLYVTNDTKWKDELGFLFNSEKNAVNIFPNPAKEIVNVVGSDDSAFKVRLLNVKNQVVYISSFETGLKTINVAKLPAGTYILEYTIGNETKAEKIIKL